MMSEKNIRLRALEPEDTDIICSVENDSSQWIENGMGAPFSRHQILQYALSYEGDPFISGQLRLIVETSQNDFVGIIDLFDLSVLNRTAFIGIYIRRELRGNGFAQIALKLMEEYAGKVLNLRILAARVATCNETSMSVFNKAGYTQSGLLPNWILSGNETYDVALFTKNLY